MKTLRLALAAAAAVAALAHVAAARGPDGHGAPFAVGAKSLAGTDNAAARGKTAKAKKSPHLGSPKDAASDCPHASNALGATRGLDRADQVACGHGAKGRARAREAQSRESVGLLGTIFD